MDGYNARLSLFTSSSYWPRMEQYELKTYKNEIYIAPCGGVRFPDYNPLDEYPELLRSFLEIKYYLPKTFFNDTKSAWEKYNDLSIEEKNLLGKGVLRFVNKWGLLGLFKTYCLTIYNETPINFDYSNIPDEYVERREGSKIFFNKTFTNTCTHVLINNQSIFRLFMLSMEDTLVGRPNTYDEYASYFFPNMHAPYPNPIHDMNIYRDKDKQNAALTSFWCIDFMTSYSEPLRLFVYEWYRLYIKYNEWQAFKSSNSDMKPEDIIKDKSGYICTISNYIADRFVTHPIKINVEYNSKKECWQINYLTENLLEAMEIMLLQNITSTNEVVTNCENCGKSFIARSHDVRYCGERCRTYVRVNRHREKIKKEVIDLFNSGVSISEISKEKDIKETVVSKWIKERKV